MAKDAGHETSPAQALMGMLLGVPVAHAIAAAAELGIFALLEAGPLDAAEIAKRASTLEDPTYRLLRGLSALGLFVEHNGRAFSLTEMGKCMLPSRPGSFDALARMNGSDWGSAPFAQFVHCLKTGESAFRRHHGEGLFAHISRYPEREQLFGNAMSTFSGMEIELVLGAYDFNNAGTIVDIGGGHGMLLSRILERAPGARGVLFDLSKVVERAKATWLGSALSRRCEAVAGDFFERVPPGGDLYVLKHILHDWDDDRAVTILKNVASAMKPGARLLIIEQGLAPPGVPSPGKIMDIVMLALVEGGRERGADEQSALFQRAGLRFEREISTPGPITLFLGSR
ncbi:MAG: methyltransferase [Myxococcota bacterium]